MEHNAGYSDQLRQYLKRILLRTAALHVGTGLVSFVALGAWVFLLLIVWTAVASEPGMTSALVVGRGVAIVLAGLFLYFVVWPLVRMPGIDRLASEVESRKDLKELVRAGFEFSNDETVSKRYSPELVKEVIRQAVERISGLEVRYLFLSRKDLALMPVAYGALVVLLAVSLVNPSILGRAGQRIVAPASVAAADHRANIYATPGNVTVLSGADITVAGLDLGQTRAPVTVSYNLAQDFWKTEDTRKVEPEAGTPGEASFHRYEFTFTDLRHSVSYRFESGDYTSETYTIKVVHKPILSDLTVRLTPPEYTGEPETVLTDNGGNVQALEGTRVRIEGKSNNPLEGAWVRFGEAEEKPVEFDTRDIRFDFAALEDGHYSVILEDTLGFRTDDPLVHTVEVYQDNPPVLDVIEPGGDAELPRNQLINISFIASDDYGVRSANVYYRKNGEQDFQRVGIALGEQRMQREVASTYQWDLTDLSLFPGNYVEYYIEVGDNNTVTGPGLTRSRMFQIRVPTMAQMYDKVKEEEAMRADRMDQAIKEGEDFRERLEKITREFIKTEKMEWSQKKEIDRAMEKQESMEEALNEIKESLDQTLEKLSENEMTSQEIGEKLEEIRELMNEIDSNELREYMKELQEAVEKLDTEKIKEALENLDLNTEEMLEKLERTANLLKQIQKEQKMEEMVRESQDLMNKQKDLNEDTSDANPSDSEKMDELAKKQEELARKADELRESMEDFAQEQSKDDQNLSQQMSEMSQEMSEQGPQENMRKASDELKQQQQQQAMEQQQQAMEKLITLFQKTQNMQMQMQQMQMQQMAMNFQKYAKRTLELSHKQEALAENLTGEKETEESLSMKQMAQRQMSYLKATEKVADEIVKMAGESMQVSQTLMESIGSAIEQMQSAILFLEQNKSFMSTAYASNAVEDLNEATIEMLSAAQQCSQGAGSGNQSMAQQMMQQLIPRQQDVMQQTQSMMEMQAMGEMLRQERQAELDRLAGEQRSIKEIAEQIQKSLESNDEKMLGRLDRTAEEMEAVVEALRRGRIDQDLVNREQRILSRLLDAQRSINTRDYEKKRESRTGDEMFSQGIDSQAKAPISQSLREEIRRAMQLKAPGEFEDLIKLYFRALAEESAVSAPN